MYYVSGIRKDEMEFFYTLPSCVECRFVILSPFPWKLKGELTIWQSSLYRFVCIKIWVQLSRVHRKPCRKVNMTVYVAILAVFTQFTQVRTLRYNLRAQTFQNFGLNLSITDWKMCYILGTCDLPGSSPTLSTLAFPSHMVTSGTILTLTLLAACWAPQTFTALWCQHTSFSIMSIQTDVLWAVIPRSLVWG